MTTPKFRLVFQSDIKNPVPEIYNNRVGLPAWVQAVEKMPAGKSVALAIGVTTVLSAVLYGITISGGKFGIENCLVIFA